VADTTHNINVKSADTQKFLMTGNVVFDVVSL